MKLSGCVLLIASTLLGEAGAFQNPNVQTGVPSSTQLHVKTVPQQIPVSTGFERIKRATNVPYGDEQRAFRRTVYTHDDWKKHRNQNRFVVYLAAIFKSGVYKNISGEVLLATGIAAFVCFYNMLVGGYVDLAGVSHAGLITSDLFPKIGIPMQAFTLTSPSLGLLLGKLVRRDSSALTLDLRGLAFVVRNLAFSHILLRPLKSVSLPHQFVIQAMGRGS